MISPCNPDPASVVKIPSASLPHPNNPSAQNTANQDLQAWDDLKPTLVPFILNPLKSMNQNLNLQKLIKGFDETFGI